MVMPVLELLGLEIAEIFVIYIFHNTGAIILRIVTFGKIKMPLLGIGPLKKRPKLRYGAICIITGILFYLSILIILVLYKTSAFNGK